DRTLDEVVPSDVAFLGRLEANGRWTFAAVLLADGAVIARLLAPGALLCSQSVEILFRHVVAVRVPRDDEPLGHFLVAREGLHLEERALVPVDPEPLQAVEDRVDRFARRALEVGVLDAQHERAAVAPRVSPGEKRGARAADMQVARRTGREARPHRHLVRAALDAEALRAPAQHAAREVGD